MNFQRQDLAGAIRTQSFIEPVSVKMRPSGQDNFFRILFVIALVILAGVLMSGCTMPKTINFAPLVQVRDSANGSANGNTVTPVAP